MSMLPRPYVWSEIARYIATVENFIRRAEAEFPLSDEDRERLRLNPELELELDVSYEDFIHTTEVFPHALRRSVFLLLFIILETRLDEICGKLQLARSNPIPLRELRGRGIHRAARYVSLLTGKRIKDVPEWEELCRFQDTRNALVHSNGVIPASAQFEPLARYAHSSPHLEMTPQDPAESPPSRMVLGFKAGFCEHALAVIQSFFESLRPILQPPGT